MRFRSTKIVIGFSYFNMSDGKDQVDCGMERYAERENDNRRVNGYSARASSEMNEKRNSVVAEKTFMTVKYVVNVLRATCEEQMRFGEEEGTETKEMEEVHSRLLRTEQLFDGVGQAGQNLDRFNSSKHFSVRCLNQTASLAFCDDDPNEDSDSDSDND